MYTLEDLQKMGRTALRRAGLSVGLTPMQVGRMKAADLMEVVLERQTPATERKFIIHEFYSGRPIPDYTRGEEIEAVSLISSFSPAEKRNVRYIIDRTGCKIQWAVQFTELRERLKRRSESLSLTAEEGEPRAYLWIRTISAPSFDAFEVLSDLLLERMPTVLQPAPDVYVGLRMKPIHHAILAVIEAVGETDAPGLVRGVGNEMEKAQGNRSVYYHANTLAEAGLIKKKTVGGKVRYYKAESVDQE